MNRRLLPLLALPFLALPLLAVSDCSGEEAQLPEPTAVIGPDVLEALEHEAEVEVLIGLREPDIPMAEWTTEIRRQNTAERQARVLSVLTDADFTLIRQFEIASALSGYLTQSGLEKLATHPEVVSVGLNWGLFIAPP